jgi:hypothetical protein
MKGKTLLKELEEENMRLKLALGESQLACHALESLVEVVNEHYQTDVKKVLGNQPSLAAEVKRRKR